MAALECLKWHNFAQSNEDAVSTEGKAGVPRYDGEITRLSEYQFRVKLRELKEKTLEEAELKKVGPLGLRLVEGLRGAALQVARSLPVDQLASTAGPAILLNALQESIQPRRKQEARELYNAGAVVGGLLSRQHGESVANYVLRRKTWYNMMTDLDPDLKLPPVILAEQILQNANLSADHQLMVRTAILGDMSIEKVTAELIAQHARLHENEKRKGSFKGYFGKSSGKGSGKDRRPWSRSYHVEEGEGWDESWDSTSQSLGGYEDVEESAYYGGADDYHETEDDPVLEAYAAMVDQGLDEDDGEAVEWAADVLQAEYEVYFARQGAKGGGHKGFGGYRRDFSVHGALTFEERKSRLQEMKQKTTCRKCGQKGHWANDPQCPKSGKKSSGKGHTGSSSASTSSTATRSFGGKSHGGGKSSGKKPRTVYFTINEYEDEKHGAGGRAYMMTGDFTAVPPPTSLGGSAGGANVTAPIYAMNSDEEMSPDDELDKMIAEAALRQAAEKPLAVGGTGLCGGRNLGSPTTWGEQPGVGAETVRSEGMMKLTAGYEESGRPDREREAHLDKYLAMTKPSKDEEYQDAYNERWNEFVPGHPLFTESDALNIARWKQKSLLGLPKLPEASTESVKAEAEVGPTGCKHERTTRQGSNAYVKVLRCKDCGLELERTKLEKAEKMETIDSSVCQHLSKDRRGTTSTTWQWKCKDCGHVEKGHKGSESEPGQSSVQIGGKQGLSPNDAFKVVAMMQTTLEIHKEVGNQISLKQLDLIYEKCKIHVARESVGVAPVAVGSSSSQDVTSTDYGQRAQEVHGEVMKREEAVGLHEKKMSTGAHQGRTYREIYEKELTYCKGLRTKLYSGSLKHASLREFARYAEARSFMKDEKVAYVFMDEDEDAEEERLDDLANFNPTELVAVLDTGCNNTCHGDRWMEKFKTFCCEEPALEVSEGRFKGVGGRVDVAGKRSLKIKMRSLDKEYLPGNITSVELCDSDAPLLLSTKAQKALGLVLDMAEHTAYSKTLDKELELVNHNGLPGLRLFPSSRSSAGLAMNVMKEVGKADGEEKEAENEKFAEEAEEEGAEERHVPLDECNLKTLSKGRKKQIEEDLEELGKEDCAMWSTLTDRVIKPKRMLPRGCRSFVMEIFAGAATLSYMAVCMGYAISAPVDIEIQPQHDLLNRANRERLGRIIEEEDPYLLAFAPVCGPWSQWQGLNMSRDEETRSKIMNQRSQWYPVIKWISGVVKDRLKKGREVLLENPWGSMLWKLRCIEEMLEGDYYNHMTGEPLEAVRCDQCMFGLVEENSGIPHQKSTGMMLSCAEMKKELAVVCDGSHEHFRLEGGRHTKLAQQWPEELCESIIRGAGTGMRNQVLYHAFPAEMDEEERSLVGPIDEVHDEHDVAEQPMKRRRVDQLEVDREENIEEAVTAEEVPMLHDREKERRRKWLRLPKEKRVAVRRLHAMMGHCSSASLERMLKASMVGKEVVDAVKHFRCQTCEELKKDENPRSVKPTRAPFEQKFNYEVSMDVFEVHDSQGQRHSILSLVDLATHFQAAFRVAGGGTPSSKVCAEAVNAGWLSWAGAPKFVVCDQGVHNKGKMSAMLVSQGTQIRQTGARAPHQLGIGERHGGLLKEVLKKAIHDRQLHGSDTISALCSEACRTKNTLVNHGGYSPAQWVLGFTPQDATSLASNDHEEFLGVHQGIVDAEEQLVSADGGDQDKFMLQLLVRQCAKEAFIQVDTSQRLRRAMLRTAVPMRGPYRPGDLVCFSKKGKWYGPARVVSNEGTSSLWLVHGGIMVLIAETSCRPASSGEILKKQSLEMRPSRGRKRQIISDGDGDDVYVPFADDLEEMRLSRRRMDGQVPFADIQSAEPPLQVGIGGSGSGVAASPDSLMEELFAPDGEEVQPQGQQQLSEEIPATTPPEQVNEDQEYSPTSSANSQPSGQPEREVSPEIVDDEGHGQSEETSGSSSQQAPNQDRAEAIERPPGLSTAILDPNRLDGFVMRRSPENQQQETTVVRGEAMREVEEEDVAMKAEKMNWSWAFMVSRQSKKVKKNLRTKKAGAGKELVYEKESEERKKKLDETRLKEWNNWKKYTNGRWVNEDELRKMKRKNPALRVVPTRWVDVNKSEEGEEEQLKSRLVVRGDLEDSSQMRTDSPTCSLTMTSMTLILASCRDSDLWAGDISAAFLQGSTLDRTLILSMPRGGIPGEIPGRYYVVSTTVYGTKDAPRGWYKNLHGTLISEGFRQVPHEAAAYVINDEAGGIAGMVVVHVDDLLWTGGSFVEEKMKKVCDIYKFGKIMKNDFKYCGREIKKDSSGVHVTCPSLIDRVKPIYLSTEQRKNKEGKVTEEIKGQLRSVIGSLAWLARVCRPDMSYGVSRLQSAVSEAKYSDVVFANSLVNVARNSREEGITYPLKSFRFEDAKIIALQDASHANDFDVSGNGKKLGFRSQSGRLLCLAGPNFTQDHFGPMLLVEWHSTVIKRVCRSTLQAETLSLLLGSEEADHLRNVYHGLSYDQKKMRQEEWIVQAMDEKEVVWYTDCKSLADHIKQMGLQVVSDKRLAIDLSGLRQMAWRKQGEQYGDTLLTDKVPEDGSTKVVWTSTDRMPADCLTKAMKPGILVDVMHGSPISLAPTKYNGCEIEEV